MACKITLELSDEGEAAFRLVLAKIQVAQPQLTDHELAALCFYNGRLFMESCIVRLEGQAIEGAQDLIDRLAGKTIPSA